MNHARAEENSNTMLFPNVAKPNQRRASTTTYSTQGTEQSEDFSTSNHSVEDQALVKRLIKQEMVQSLTRVAAARLRQNPEATRDLKETHEAIRKIATMVLEGEDTAEDAAADAPHNQDLKPDQNLRDLLREALVVDDNEETVTEGDQVSTADLKDAPLDIWHSDFWGAEDLDVSNHACSMDGQSRSSARSSGVWTDSSDTQGSQSLQEYLANLKEISSSDSEQSDDDCSVLSDISGLTEVFPEDSERSAKVKVHRSKVLLEAVPTTLQVEEKQDKKARKVVFDRVIVRKYERILCDNPAVSSGPSLGVGWRYKPQTPVRVDHYEKNRAPRKAGSQLILSREHREKLVRRMGHSDREIAEMVRSVNKTKNQRRQTLNNLGVEKMEFAVESAKRRLKSFLSFKKNA